MKIQATDHCQNNADKQCESETCNVAAALREGQADTGKDKRHKAKRCCTQQFDVDVHGDGCTNEDGHKACHFS